MLESKWFWFVVGAGSLYLFELYVVGCSIQQRSLFNDAKSVSGKAKRTIDRARGIAGFFND